MLGIRLGNNPENYMLCWYRTSKIGWVIVT